MLVFIQPTTVDNEPQKKRISFETRFFARYVITIKFRILYSMKIKEQTRKLAAGCT